MKYRKKPVVIEAYQTDKEMDIETLEGTMHASVGDYIITGVRGEQYPCKPDIFEQTYEPADVPAASPWHRVEDGLPKEAGEYIVAYHPCWWDDVKTSVTEIGIDTFRGKTSWAKRKFQRVTHWMEKPEPPKEDE